MTADPFEAEWPAGEQDITRALAAVPDDDEVPGLELHPGRRAQGERRRPTFTPHAGDRHALQVGPLPHRTPSGMPGRWAGMRPPGPVVGALRQQAASQPLHDQTPAVDDDRTPLFDLTEQEHGQPAAAAPVRSVPDSDATWLLDFLTDLLDDAAEGAAHRLTGPCPTDEGTPTGWCDDCTGALARAAAYARLAELLEAAPGDKAAIAVLLAEGWREG